MNKKVSLIITTKNEEDNIQRLLESITKQNYKNIEIIVVDNNSSDNTKKIARKFTSLVFNRGPERSAQRNFAVKKSSGSYLLFLDADMELMPQVVKECLVLVTKEKNIGGVIIPEKSSSQSFWEKIKAYERSFYFLNGESNIEAARFISKRVFIETGGYDEEITGPEDWDLSERIKSFGYKLKRSKCLLIHYENINSLIELMKKKYYYGVHSHKYLHKNNLSIFNSKTIFFLRPVFFKNWRLLISNPSLTVFLILMFSAELLSGGFGYLVGRLNRK